MKVYVAKKGVLSREGVYYAPGQVLPQDISGNPDSLVEMGFLSVHDEAPVAEEVTGKPGAQTIGKWLLDPADLAELSLDELNVILAEMAPNEPAFEDRATGIAYLSRDRA